MPTFVKQVVAIDELANDLTELLLGRARALGLVVEAEEHHIAGSDQALVRGLLDRVTEPLAGVHEARR
jgi:hypothetical protein